MLKQILASGPSSRTGWLLLTLLAACFLFGGASRPDVFSNAVLRPMAFLFCGVGVLTLSSEHVSRFRTEFLFLAAIALLLLLHVIPLPPSIWQLLPGREVLVEIDRAAGIEGTWRPVAMVPAAAWNALFSLCVPAAALILGSQLEFDESRWFIKPLIVFGFLSALLGVMQLLGGDAFYLYRVTNEGMPVGIFANRNHHAVVLALVIPMLAVWASQKEPNRNTSFVRLAAAAIGVLALVPIILATGSRAGLALGLLCLAVVPFVFSYSVPGARRGAKPLAQGPLIAVGAAAVTIMGAITVTMQRVNGFQRLLDGDDANEMRFAVWGPLIEFGMKYFPIGSGSGSFAEVYQIDEPEALLGPIYLNHAHNDYLQIYFTLGIVGIVLLALAAGILAKSIAGAVRDSSDRPRGRFARMGAIIVVVMSLASVVDYPLRVPYCAALLVVALIWLRGAANQRKAQAGSFAAQPALKT